MVRMRAFSDGRGISRCATLLGVLALAVALVAGCTSPTQREVASEPADDAPEAATQRQGDHGSGEIVAVTSSTFEAKVLEADVPVLVDFTADWCPPCKALHPRLEKVAKDYAGRAKVAQVDVDESPDLAREYSVRGIPALFVIRGGEVVDTAVGLQSQQALEEMLDRAVE